MKKRLIACLMSGLLFWLILSVPVTVVANAMVFHEEDGNLIRHNLDGSKTLQITAETSQGMSPAAMSMSLSMDMEADAIPTAETKEIEFTSQFYSTAGQGQPFMKVQIGDGSVSFAAIPIEGAVTVDVLVDTILVEKTPEATMGVPTETSSPEASATPLITESPIPEGTFTPEPTETTAPEESPETTPEATPEETTEATEPPVDPETSSTPVAEPTQETDTESTQFPEATEGTAESTAIPAESEAPEETMTAVPEEEATQPPETAEPADNQQNEQAYTPDPQPTETPTASPSPSPTPSPAPDAVQEEAEAEAPDTAEESTSASIKAIWAALLGSVTALAEEGETEGTPPGADDPTPQTPPEEMDGQAQTDENPMPPLVEETPEAAPETPAPTSPQSPEMPQTPYEPEYVEEEIYESRTYRESSPGTVTGSGSGSPEATSKSMTYAGLFDEVTDVRLRGSEDKVKEDIIIHEYIGGHVFRYAMTTENLTAVQEGSEIELYNLEGTKVATVESPYMDDAAGAHSGSVGVSLSGGGRSYTLTYTPDDAWLAAEERVYPVTVDPTLTYEIFDNSGGRTIEDNGVSSKNPDTPQNPNATYLRVGNDGTATYYAYVRWAIPDWFKQKASSIIIEKVRYETYPGAKQLPNTLKGTGTYDFYPLLGSWNENTLTYNNAPVHGTAGASVTLSEADIGLRIGVDVTEMFSPLFNTLDQQTGFGFVIKERSNTPNVYVDLMSSKQVVASHYVANFYVTYWEDLTAPTLTATSHGNAKGSGTGYATLSWTPVEGAQGYYVGIHNGSAWEYIDVGNVTTYSTQGKGLWPTAAEIQSGRYKLHLSGGGSELSMVPTPVYKNAGKSGQDSNYYFSVVPRNAHGQAPNPSQYGASASVALPDTIAPSQPASISIIGATDTKANNITVSWSGVTDITTSGTETSTLTGGKIQYALKDPANEASWKDIGSNAVSGTKLVDISTLSDGAYKIYIRGVDKAGNAGASKSADFGVDRTGPTAPSVAVSPASWTNASTVKVSWSGITDISSLSKVERKLATGAWTATGSTGKAGTIEALDVSILQGIQNISIRGTDSLGNVGSAGEAKLYLDRTNPEIGTSALQPATWTNSRLATLSWSAVTDTPSGLQSMRARVNGQDIALPGTAKGSFDLDTVALKDGTHTIPMTVVDKAGNTTAKSHTLQIDRTKPVIGASSVQPSGWTSASSVALSWSGITDAASKLQSMEAEVANVTTSLNLSAASSGSQKLGISTLADGTHWVFLTAKDNAGNETTANHLIQVDRTKPAIGSLGIQPSSWTSAQSVTLSWSGVTDTPSGVKDMKAVLDGVTTPLATAQSGSKKLSTTGLQDGSHTLSFSATDNADNQSTTTQTVYIDRTKPVIGDISLQPASWTNAPSIDLHWSGITDATSGLQGMAATLNGNTTTLSTASAASGVQALDTSGLSDGLHAVYLTATDNASNQTTQMRYASIDRTNPVIGSSAVQPSGWTHAEAASLTWAGVEDALSGLQALCAVFDGTTTELGVSDADGGSLALDTAALPDGTYPVTLTALDQAGNETSASWDLFIDRTSPVIGGASLEPAEWSTSPSVDLRWFDIHDDLSGLQRVEADFGGESSEISLDLAAGGSLTLDTSALPDGAYPVTLTTTDNADNTAEETLQVLVDRTSPELTLHAPVSGTIAGVAEVWATVQDLSLDSWTLTAADETGARMTLATGGANATMASLGRLNTSLFEDGALIYLTLEAVDLAGNSHAIQTEHLVINNAAQPVEGEVTIGVPAPGQVVTGNTAGSYQPQAPENEVYTNIYIDGRLHSQTSGGGGFSVHPVYHEENSLHTITAITLDTEGNLSFSNGLSLGSLKADSFIDNASLLEDGGLAFSQEGATGEGTILSQPITCGKPVYALLLDAVVTGDVAFEYAHEGDWHPITPGVYALLPQAVDSVQVRAHVHGTLHSWNVQGVTEMNPDRFVSKLQQEVSEQSLSKKKPSTAVHPLLEDAQAYDTLWQFVDGVLVETGADFNVLLAEEGSELSVVLLGERADGSLHGNGNLSSQLLCRETLTSHDSTTALQRLESDRKLYAIRVVTDSPEAALSCSVDGVNWIPIAQNQYAILPSASQTVWVKAEPIDPALFAWHIEGVTATEELIPVELMKAPQKVAARDYGRYPAAEQRVELTWQDPNTQDTSLDNIHEAVIEKNGIEIGRTVQRSWTDASWEANAAYQVYFIRTYALTGAMEAAGYQGVRRSTAVPAAITVVPSPTPKPTVVPTPTPTPSPSPSPSPSPTAVPTATLKPTATVKPTPIPTPTLRPTASPTPTAPPTLTPTASPTASPAATATVQPTEPPSLEELRAALPKAVEKQSDEMDYLYAGQYTFVGEPTIPDNNRVLDEKLLGKNKYCALGFEPINFNTGNFLLAAQDIYQQDVGAAALDISRHYNSLSTQKDGPFGAGWSFGYGQAMVGYADGSYRYMQEDGAIFLFKRQADGSYKGNDDDSLQLTVDETTGACRVQEKDGNAYGFDLEGYLVYVEAPGQVRITLERNEMGQLEEIVAPSGARLSVTIDAFGHIASVQSTSGLEIRYTYKDGLLTLVEDSQGGKTRYEYDENGWMTAWYDANGVCQAANTYDATGRVVHQKDALGGEYTLTYYDGYTATVDAQGVRNEIHYDALGRTVKLVDGEGRESLYIYGGQGMLEATTDALGQLTTYEYDERGNMIRHIAPNGATVQWTYDDSDRMVSKTDQNGHTTQYAYDAAGNLIRQENPDGGILTYEYNAKGQKVAETDALGHTITYAYQGANMTKKTDALGNETLYAYDAGNRINWQKDALGNETEYQYDVHGNLTEIRFADGTKASYTYDAMGNTTSMTDMLGGKTAYEYNPLGQLVKTTYPDRSVETRTYTPSYQLASITDAEGAVTTYSYDAAGNKISETDALGHTTAYVYDGENRLVQEILPTGVGSAYAYDETTSLVSAVTNKIGVQVDLRYDLGGNLLSETKPNGAAVTYAYDSMGRKLSQTNASGGTTSYAYDLNGRVISITNPLGGKTVYTYNAAGNLQSESDSTGYRVEYTYDALGRIAGTVNSAGAETAYTYDLTGNLVQVTDAYGNTQAYAYDANGRLTGMTDPLGASAQLTYDKMDNLVEIEEKNGGKLKAEYDKAGRLVAETDALGNVTRHAYDAKGQLSSTQDALRNVTQYERDTLGNTTAVIRPDGLAEQYRYSNAGQVISTVDATGLACHYTYDAYGNMILAEMNDSTVEYAHDAAGQIISMKNAAGGEASFAYDAAGNLTEVRYADGSADRYAYDEMGRILSETPVHGPETTYEYNAQGEIAQITQGERTVRYEYDLLGRVSRILLPDGESESYAYDALGNMIAHTDANGSTLSYAYNAQSLVTAITDANGTQYSYAYDLAGNVIEETDTLGHKTSYAYDKRYQLTQTTDALGHKTRYTYDAMGKLTSQTDALGHKTAYEYDARGQLIAETDADGNTERYTYTPEGWLSEVIRPDGGTITHAYNEMGLLTEQKANGKTVLEQTYNETGRQVTTTGADGQAIYQYDARDQLTWMQAPTGDKVTYAYDDYGRKTAVTYPDGSQVQYAYDLMDRLSAVTEPDGAITRYAYDAAGRRILTEGAGLTTAYEYDGTGQLIRQQTQGRSELGFTYERDAMGRIVKEERAEAGIRILSEYSYDQLGQLLSYTASDGYAESYAYDAAGNMVKKEAEGLTYSMKYGKNNQLTEMRANGQKLTYAYDTNGNLTEKALGDLVDRYTYDALGNLASYTGHDDYRQTYAYSLTDVRTQKAEQGNPNRLTLEEVLAGKTLSLVEQEMQGITGNEWVKTDYIQDITQPYAEVLLEKTGGATTAYTYGLERIAGYTSGASVSSLKKDYMYDGRGSVAQVLSTVPELPGTPGTDTIQTLRYTPFGEQIGEKVSGYGYNGEQYDAATGMLHLRAREYEPGMNQFSQKDRLRGDMRNPTSLNRYAYCWNDPVTYHDANGLRPEVCDDGGSGSSSTTRAREQAALDRAKANARAEIESTPEYWAGSNGLPITNKTITSGYSDYGYSQEKTNEYVGMYASDPSIAYDSRSSEQISSGMTWYEEVFQKREAERARVERETQESFVQESLGILSVGSEEYSFLTDNEKAKVEAARKKIASGNLSTAELKQLNEELYGYCTAVDLRKQVSDGLNTLLDWLLGEETKTSTNIPQAAYKIASAIAMPGVYWDTDDGALDAIIIEKYKNTTYEGIILPEYNDPWSAIGNRVNTAFLGLLLSGAQSPDAPSNSVPIVSDIAQWFLDTIGFTKWIEEIKVNGESDSGKTNATEGTGSSVGGSRNSSAGSPSGEKPPDDKENSSKGNKNTESVSKISNSTVKHIDAGHNPSSYAQQLQYKSKEIVEGELEGKTFFSKDWTSGQIQEAVLQGYSDALADGVLNDTYTYMYNGETITVAIKNGVVQSAWGDYSYTYEELLNMLK